MIKFEAIILHSSPEYTDIKLWINGDLITTAPLVIRNRDVPYLIDRLKPERIAVDRENMSADLWKRIKQIPEVELI